MRDRNPGASEIASTAQEPLAEIFVFRDGVYFGAKALSAGTYVIGSGPGADLRLEGDERIAPHHATLLLQPGRMAVDCPDAEGLKLNGFSVSASYLATGDEVRCGRYLLVVERAGQRVPAGLIRQVQLANQKTDPESRPRPITAEGLPGRFHRTSSMPTVAALEMRERPTTDPAFAEPAPTRSGSEVSKALAAQPAPTRRASGVSQALAAEPAPTRRQSGVSQALAAEPAPSGPTLREREVSELLAAEPAPSGPTLREREVSELLAAEPAPSGPTLREREAPERDAPALPPPLRQREVPKAPPPQQQREVMKARAAPPARSGQRELPTVAARPSAARRPSSESVVVSQDAARSPLSASVVVAPEVWSLEDLTEEVDSRSVVVAPEPPAEEPSSVMLPTLAERPRHRGPGGPRCCLRSCRGPHRPVRLRLGRSRRRRLRCLLRRLLRALPACAR